jgi:undecaprenyl-diphosphatase
MRGIVSGSKTVHASIGAVLIAIVFAFIFGYLSIAFLLRFLARHSLVPFVAYRVVLGVVVLALTAASAIH